MALSTATRTYRVTHRTGYHYGDAVEAGHTIAHLVPRTLPHQTVRQASVESDPRPGFRQEHLDGFGNHVTYLALDRPHDQLTVTATSEVELHPRPQPVGAGWDTPWEAAVAATAVGGSADGLLARQCQLDSPRVTRHPDLRAFAARDFGAGRPLRAAATAICQRIHDEFEFVPGVTDVATSVLEVLAERRGVCQDFAHLLTGALRSLGLGARYVSGYLETEPPPGSVRLAGADASHAWVGLAVPGHGWVDLDPTNGLVQPDRHITVAWGRDYTDVVPVRGVLFGPRAEQQMEISVDVVRLAAVAG